MTRRLTDGHRAARRELCALARTALDVCDVIAARLKDDKAAAELVLGTAQEMGR